MIVREAIIEDIGQMHAVRTSVNENQLSDPNLVTPKDYEEYLLTRGKGWVALRNDVVAGFAIVDLKENNVWALFVQPAFERKGIGKMLHDEMINWYFTQTEKTIWLSTSPDTRAESFYKIAGWQQTGVQGNGELKFELRSQTWRKLRLYTQAK